MYKVTIDLPSLVDGGEVYVPGIGALVKGQDNIVSDEVASSFQDMNVRHEPAYATDEDGEPAKDENGNQIQVGMSQVRVPFSELLEDLQGIHVEEYDPSAPLSLEDDAGETHRPSPNPTDNATNSNTSLDLDMNEQSGNLDSTQVQNGEATE